MNYDIVFDEDGMLAKAYGGVKVTPTSFLVSPKGKITLHKMGMLEMDAMRQTIEGMLKG